MAIILHICFCITQMLSPLLNRYQICVDLPQYTTQCNFQYTKTLGHGFIIENVLPLIIEAKPVSQNKLNLCHQ